MPSALDFVGADYGIDTDLGDIPSSFVGEGGSEHAPSSISNRGDVNGDGYDDILIGVYQNGDNGPYAGKVYLFLGGQTGWGADISLSTADASFLGEATGDTAGYIVDIAGDVNGDGYDDIIISAHESSTGASNAGKVHLVLGKASGWALDTDLSTADASFLGEASFDYAGGSLAGVGDVNGDGYADFMVGAPEKTVGGGNAGKTYLIFGKEAGWERGVSLADADATFLGEAATNYFGHSIAGAGDVDGDGLDDIIVGAYGYWPGGKVYIILGMADGWSLGTKAGDLAVAYTAESSNDNAGMCVAGAGDVNGDGLDDVLVGAPYITNQPGNIRGGVYLFLGSPSGWTNDTDLSDADTYLKGYSNQAGFPGCPLSGAGDVNGDGFADILISAPADSEVGAQSGQTYLFLGSSTIWAGGTTFDQADASFMGVAADDRAGQALGGVGDVDGDGLADFLIGAPNNDDSTADAGKAYLVMYDHNTLPTDLETITAYASPDFTNETGYAMVWDTIFVEMVGNDTNASGVEVAVVNVTSDASPLGFQMSLIETGNDTGVYRGDFTVANRTHDAHRWINASLGDTVMVTPFAETAPNASIIIGGIGLAPPINVTNATEDIEYVLNYTAFNVTTPIWDIDTNATWLDLNATTGNLSGVPINSDVGHVHVNLTLRDGFGRFVRHDINFSVINVPPEILPVNMTNATEDEYFEVDFNSSDDGQGDITWTMETDTGDWLSLNASSGVINGTPSNTDVGTFYLNMSVDDGNGGVNSTNLTLLVIDINEPPTIVGIDKTEVHEDEYYEVDYQVDDVDIYDTHFWDIETDAEWLFVLHFEGILSGTPSNDDVGLYHVNLSVTDSGGLSDNRSFTIEVINVNDDPFWVTVPEDTTIYSDEHLSLDAVADDIDAGDTITYGLETDPPTSATIGAASGILSWDPDSTGTFVFTISASDGNVTIHHEFTVEVEKRNTLPVASLLTPANGASVDSARPTLDWDIVDPDGDTITSDIYLSTNKAYVDNLDARGKLTSIMTENYYTLTKDLTPGSTYYWTIIPFDGEGTGTCSNGPFSFTVASTAPVNHKPTIEPIGIKTVKAGKLLEFTVAASDPDAGATLTYELTGEPAGMSIAANGTVTWTPTEDQIGNYTVTVTVSDGELEESADFTVQVTKAGEGGEEEEEEEEEVDDFTLLVIAAVIIVLVILILFTLMRGGDKAPEKDEKVPARDVDGDEDEKDEDEDEDKEEEDKEEE